MTMRMLAPFLPYIIVAALLTALASVVWWQSGTIDTLRGDVARLERSLAVVEAARKQARLAASVAQAAANRAQTRAAEYDRMRENLLKGNTDEELPDWFREYLDDLLGGLRDPR